MKPSWLAICFVALGGVESIAGSEQTDQTVLAAQNNDWMTGVLVGEIHKAQWKEGLFWSSGEISVQTADYNGNAAHPSVYYQLSIPEDSQALWQSIDGIDLNKQPAGSVFVFYFKSRSFFDNPFNTEHAIHLTGIQRQDKGVQHSAMHQTNRDGVEISRNNWSRWFFDEKTLSGHVVRVQRVDRWLFSDQCLVDVHLGGYKSVVRYYGQELPVRSKDFKKLDSSMAFRRTVQLPDLGQFSTTDSRMCRYAEATALSGQTVDIVFSGDFGSTDSITRGEIHKISQSSDEEQF